MINDLRSAIDYLKTQDNEFIETSTVTDLNAELAGVYRYVGAGGTVKRPTKCGPAMMFNNIKGYPGSRVLIGLLSSRERVGLLLGEKPERLGRFLKDSLNNPIAPVVIPAENAKCREVIHPADGDGFDLRALIPASTNTPDDAGPYITLGMCYATHPDTGKSDITIHRMCIQGRDELSIFFTPGSRHIGAMAVRASELNIELPISISIGVDPAIEIATCFEPPTTPLGLNELSIAGALRNKAVELAPCVSVGEYCIANAEYVIEGKILPNVYVREDQHSNLGYSMPEFPGYTGESYGQCSLIKVTAVTHRKNPIMQTCIGPSEEHVSMAGIPMEASILDMVERALPDRLLNVYAHSSGGGKFMAIMQFRKRVVSDEGRQRQAALLAFAAFSELKHVILVDDDVDIFDTNDVMWAMNTRYQGDVDTIFVPKTRCHPLDPTQSPEYNPNLPAKGTTCKTIFDCTVPFNLKDKFVRARFKEVDYKKWLNG